MWDYNKFVRKILSIKSKERYKPIFQIFGDTTILRWTSEGLTLDPGHWRPFLWNEYCAQDTNEFMRLYLEKAYYDCDKNANIIYYAITAQLLVCNLDCQNLD